MWTYKNNIIDLIPDDTIGFVYCITNLTNNKKYIGKKLFLFSKTSYKTIKSKDGVKKKRRVHTKVESDWQTYWGSNQYLIEDVNTLGSTNFTREILHFCKTKAECSYLELKEQIVHGVLESDDYYNGIIQVKIHKNHLKSRK